MGIPFFEVLSDPSTPFPPHGTSVVHDATRHSREAFIYSCKGCHTHLTKSPCLISRNFSGKLGRAILFDHVWNFSIGKAEHKMLMTGKHICADIFCANCNVNIGWTYIHAYNEKEKYKIGRFVLETGRIDELELSEI